MFDAGSAIGKLGLDISGYTKGMLTAQGLASVFPSVVTNFLANPLIALAGILKQVGEAFTSTFLGFARAADNMGEMADAAGVSVQFLTSVGAVAKDAGASVEGLANAMSFLGKNQLEALSGKDKDSAAMFAQLGVALTDVSGIMRSTEDVFFDLADAFKRLEPQERIAASMQLLGHSGRGMINTLSQGSGPIKAFAADIVKLGGAVSESEAALGDKFGKMETLIKAAMDGIKKALVLPALQLLGDNADEVKKKIMDFSEAAQEWIGKAMEFIKGHVGPAFEKMKQIWAEMAPVAKMLWTDAEPLMSAAVDAVVSIGKLLTSMIKPTLDAIGPILTQLGSLLGPILTQVARLSDWLAKVVEQAVELERHTRIIGAALGTGGGFGAVAGGAGRAVGGSNSQGGGGQINTGPINVTVQRADVEEIAEAMAKKINEATGAEKTRLANDYIDWLHNQVRGGGL